MAALLLAITLVFGCIGAEADAAAQSNGSTESAALEHPNTPHQVQESLQRTVSPGDAQNPVTPEEPKKEYWTVTFYFKSGKLQNDPNTTKLKINVEKNQVLNQNMAPILNRTGYLFQGWKDTTGAFYTFGQPLSGNLTLNASWKAITYKVHFNPNGGTGSMNDQSFTYGKSKTLTKNSFKRSGYTFVGWNTKKDGTGTSYTNRQKVLSLSEKQGDVIQLYAMWQGYSYRIHYEGNGATSGAMADSLHVYGTKSPLSKNSFKRK